jgi:hypothetical protein
VELNESIPDKHVWRLSSSGQYTAKSAYTALFYGAISFEPFERIGFPLQASTQQRAPTLPCFMEPSLLNPLREFGKLGRPQNADFLCG